MPKGWRVGKFSDVAVIKGETINPQKHGNESFDYHSLPAFDSDKMPEQVLGVTIMSNKFLVPAGAILISKLNPRIPRLWLLYLNDSRRSICSTEFLVLNPLMPDTRFYVYAVLNEHSFMTKLSAFATGTSNSHQRIQPSNLADTEIILPPKNLRLAFHARIASAMTKLHLNKTAAVLLANLRDTLLPKLISGELRIRDVERFVENL